MTQDIMQPNTTPLRKAALAILLTAILGLAADRKIAPDLANLPSGKTVNIIVRFAHKAQAQDHAAVSQLGGNLKLSLDVINSAAYSMPSQALQGLSHNPQVQYITADRRVASTLDYANPAVQAGIARQYGWDGTGVTVAVIDSGMLSSHPDLMDATGTSRVVYSQSFISEPSGTSDQYGHGTHVAGILGGNATQSTGAGYLHSFWGIAPKVKFVSLKVLDSNGAGTDSDVINAIQRAIALKDTYNIRVINLSLGRPVMESYTVDPLCQAVEQAWQAGIVVVVAAGNAGRNNSAGTFGYGTIASPGNDPYVITVGAMKDGKTVSRADDQMASYSSKGPTLLDGIAKPDLVAPGNRIISAIPASAVLTSLYQANNVPNNYYIAAGNAQPSNSYFELSGTSMATPMVAGAAALLLQQQPNLTPDQVKAKLMKTATKNFPSSTVTFDQTTGVAYTTYYDLFTVVAG